MESEAEALMIRRGSVDNVQGEQGIVVRFRMEDGTEICQDTFAPSITVASLKQRLLTEWPQDREVIPRSVDDIRLLIDRRVLEDSETLTESTSSNLIDDVITVLAVVINVRAGKSRKAMGPQVLERRRNVLAVPGEQGIKLQFRLADGEDICQGTYSSSTTVAALKEMLVAEWPQDRRVIPESAYEVRLLFDGRFMEDRKTLAQCTRRSRLGDVGGRTVTMLAQVAKGRRKPEESAERDTERRASSVCQCCMVL